MTQIYGIAAHPVAHSLSPQMQQAAFDALGLPARFERFDIAPEELGTFINRVRQEGICGLAVSLPLKEIIIPFLDEISETAKKIGAVNTVYWKGSCLCGENTDAPGFWEAVSYSLPKYSHIKAAVIGAGGASRAIVFALKEQGIAVSIFNRTIEKAKALAADFDGNAQTLDDFQASGFDLVVNATSVGLKSDLSPVLEPDWEGFAGVAFDAVFDPLQTRFLQDARAHGATIITGETMLLNQGIRQFEIWTGKNAPAEVMQEALSQTLTL